MAQKFANAARGLLSAGINNSTTTIEITEGGSLFPVANGTDWFKAVLQDGTGIEIVTVTGHTSGSNTFTVTRGQEGTTARSFALGSVFGQRVTAGDMEAAVAGGGGDVTLNTAQTLDNKTLTSLNTGQLAGLRNKIINGKMEIAQRGTSFPAIASSNFSLDRFRWVNNTAGVFTVSQDSDVPSEKGFRNSLRVQVTTADTSISGSETTGIRYAIEGYDIGDLIGRVFTLSFWVKSNKVGVYCVTFRNSAQDRSYIAEFTVNTSNAWEQKLITINGGLIASGSWAGTSGMGLNIGWSLACGSTFHSAANAWQTGNFVATSNQVNFNDTIGNVFAITGVQLEVGSVATPFEHRPFGTELALCQRYYYRASGINYFFNASSYITNSYLDATVPFPVVMRSAPNALEQSGTAGHYTIICNVAVTACTTVPAFANASIYSARIYIYATAGHTAGNAAQVYISNASGYLGFASEL
jgi:hypothetical protein